MKNLVVLDCEVYPNYTLFAFKNITNSKVVTIEMKGENTILSTEDCQKLALILKSRTTFGFNSNNYDIPIILYALKSKTCKEIYHLSNYIIDTNNPGWKTIDKFNLRTSFKYKHIDIKEVAPGVAISLKLYGGRIHSDRLQDLPIEPGSILSEKDMKDTLTYCINDLDTTIDLYNEIKDFVDLRVDMSTKYNINLTSKSDAQIAESVIKKKLRTYVKAPKLSDNITFKYDKPSFIKFKCNKLNQLLSKIESHNFEIDGKGSMKLPDFLKTNKIEIGKGKYQMGIGGIHSTEKDQVIIADKDELLLDRDVTSYYPSLIINNNWFPKQLGPKFIKVYKDIVDERLGAKRKGDKITSDSLKIVVNGSFGKFGSNKSSLYSPGSFINTTLTGQLSLFMLIESLEENGIRVVSSNTDGFVSLLKKDDYELFDNLCFDWELNTNLNLEETSYKALYSKDVNNYFAITESGLKRKGIFKINDVSKNPAANISIEAVINYLVENINVEKTIKECKDIKQFLYVRRVTGGATYGSDYLGRVVRWYYSKDGHEIRYKKPNKQGNHNLVPKSEGGKPLMELNDLPEDIDYDKYVSEAYEIINKLTNN